jgi:hypothetical protein
MADAPTDQAIRAQSAPSPLHATGIATEQVIQTHLDPSPLDARGISIDLAIRARPDPSLLHALGMIALAWVPAIIVIAAIPRFLPAFDRWQWELPPLTRALMTVGRLGTGPLVLASLVLVALMAGGYAGWVRAGWPGRRALYLVLAMAGLVTFFVVGVLGELVPIFTAPIGR